ncbi:hypothetical protein M405DRAFT_806273 [Rhizopogon salebrosus TDB-379]|nr:hypothetical protein M405DRAFT_806273 [Rhizopogon salebrosus TDB-379]
MLTKHEKLSSYRVTEKKRYTFKYLPGASRSRTEAMDVDNKDDYAEMAKKIISEKLKKVKIFVDMKHVEKLPVSTQNEGSTGSHESGQSDDEETVHDTETSTSELEREIARYRRLIINKWGNDYDNLVKYIHPSGMEIPCTPAMIKDWARAMYDGEATTSMPPNILSFDPMKQEPVLHPMRRATPTVTTPAAAPNASEISSLTSMLLLRTVRDLTYNHDHVPSTPTPLPHIIDNPAELARSPLIPTPSKLRRFLQYAEDDLGVNFATSYESSLRSIGAGPDILSEISDQELSRIGLTPGDIIRLKKGSITWWNGPLAKSEPNDSAKRKRSDTTDSAIPECRKYQLGNCRGKPPGIRDLTPTPTPLGFIPLPTGMYPLLGKSLNDPG